jgi:hypothetical protein
MDARAPQVTDFEGALGGEEEIGGFEVSVEDVAGVKEGKALEEHP